MQISTLCLCNLERCNISVMFSVFQMIAHLYIFSTLFIISNSQLANQWSDSKTVTASKSLLHQR